MSRFMNPRYAPLEAYTPGEQPRDRQYIKLNTNESPYPPSPEVMDCLTRQEAADLRLYSDPEGAVLKGKLAGLYGLKPENVFLSNGSDDILNFAFMAFGADGAVAAGITYSFYPVFAQLNGITYDTIPLREDFSLDVDAFCGTGRFTVITNPNAPTGLAISLDEVERVVASNPDHVVLIDEAYVDFGAQSAVSLVEKYPNLLVVMTYSKSRSMAGARLGFAMGSAEIIADLEKLKFSTNPYNVNRLTLKMGEAAVDSDAYFRDNARKIMDTRTDVMQKLRAMGFRMPDSRANFIFVSCEGLDGGLLYRRMKEKGILIRHFSDPRLADYNRVTIGTPEEMDAFVRAAEEILKEEGLL